MSELIFNVFINVGIFEGSLPEFELLSLNLWLLGFPRIRMPGCRLFTGGLSTIYNIIYMIQTSLKERIILI